MDKTKSSSNSAGATRQIQLAGPGAPFKLVQTDTGKATGAGTPNAVPPDADDPTGVKNYIAFSVAHGVYPKGAGINPDQDISDDVKLNSDTIATEVNVDAQHSATIHKLKWNQVTAVQIAALMKVSDLVSLIKKNLTDPQAVRSGP